jgi:oligogalacturonide transporter
VLMAEIQRFKAQSGTEPTPEQRRIVEDLSGWPYERLWGRSAAPVTSPGQSLYGEVKAGAD